MPGSRDNRLLDQLRHAIAQSLTSPFEKHVHVLLKASALLREMGGAIGILCKSGTCCLPLMINAVPPMPIRARLRSTASSI